MPSKKQYNLVHNDEYDTRIPLHSEEAFHRGIIFHAKFIGSMEVPRPTSRMEIVAAMRRIRYEFKAKGIKKKKVTLEVSVDGMKITLRKKKKKQHWLDENKLILMHHPIYRIFYVSHDSHDLKIFSYIARDGNGNNFRCNVFKSNKKSQAMRVVRTVGQAFEVCHKLSINSGPEDKDRHDKDRDTENHRRDDDYDDQSEIASVQPQPSPSSLHKDISLLGDEDDLIPEQTSVPLLLRSHDAAASTTPIRQSPMESITPDSGNLLAGGELTALKHEIQLLRERLDQQNQQTRAAVAHARLLQDQLAAETAARVEAQARTHQLLVQNKELLEHIAALVSHLREHERITGVPLTGQSQVTNAAAISQTSAVADLSSLGQPVSQDNSWEPEASIFPYSSSDLLYLMNCSPLRLSEGNNYTDELYMQKQFLEKLGNHSSYQLPSYLPSSAYTMGARIIFPPSQSMNSSLRSQRCKIPFLPSDLTENNSNLDRTTCSKCNCTKIGNSYTNRLQFQGRSMDDTKPSTLESPSRRINGIENLNSNKETTKLDLLLDSLNIIDELQNREKFQVQSKTQIRRNSK